MNADRETNHDMTNGDIASMLAGAADEVEIGTAPYEAVIRGGRRRKARRWAVTAAAALVLAGSSATLAVAGLPGGDGTVAPPAATRSATPAPDLFTPARTTLATGTENGKNWRVAIDVWAAPRTEAQAAGQLEAMGEYGDAPAGTKPSELIGKRSYLVWLSSNLLRRWPPLPNPFGNDDTMSGTDLQTVSIPFFDVDPDGLERLVIGMVGKDVQQVTCNWKNGTATKVDRAPQNEDTSTDVPAIRPAEGSPVDWFVCLAPKGTEASSAEVTAVR
ncbi:hypothetical protein ACFWWC_21015 [Streptomyces sp. NPDC058642]|uniref:hypothetical protein n=1 Tax=Streptomyces sp. NPDC058642 TaxID=3346572 RepID=UPI003662085B